MASPKSCMLAVVVAPFALLLANRPPDDARQSAADMLATEVSLRVYPQEMLESVLFRLHTVTRHSMEWDTRMLSDCQAKPAVYKKVLLKAVLDEQLEGTPIRYELRKKMLVFYRVKVENPTVGAVN